MYKYVVVNNDKVLARGESKYYEDFRGFVPDGYRYTWAFRSPGGLIINIEKNI